jgi:GTPase SAR1 family protein
MCIAYSKGEFPVDHLPTVYNSIEFTEKYNEIEYNFIILDQGLQDEFDRIYRLSYYNLTVCVMAFSIVDHFSFQNVKERWMNELLNLSPETKVILVGK